MPVSEAYQDLLLVVARLADVSYHLHTSTNAGTRKRWTGLDFYYEEPSPVLAITRDNAQSCETLGIDTLCFRVQAITALFMETMFHP